MKRRYLATATLAGFMAASAGTAAAQELTIGLAAEPSSIDPHYHNLTPNNALRRHIFEGLIGQDANQTLMPELAISWEPTSDTTWEFKLREGVKFHDGTDFTANDVVFTFCRIPNVPNSPSSFAVYSKAIQSVETPDPYTLIIHTAEPYPLLANDLSTFGIISAETAGVGEVTFSPDGCEGVSEYPATEAFNQGEMAVGTGPYKFVEFVRGARIVLEANEDYWGEQPEWDRVEMRPITEDGPRVAALLAGDVDLIENPPLQDLEMLRGRDDVTVVQGLSNRVIYIHMDQFSNTSPGITGTGDQNPLQDVRVREALSKAINREAIAARIMGGVAEPASQLVAPGLFGYNEELEVEPYDPEGAQQLLADAGYPDGFGLVLGTPNDRYINDERIAQAVAQMWARIGIDVTVDAQTKSVFFSRRNNYEFSTYLAGWSSGTGEASSPLKALVATPNPEIGYGGTNRGRYSNPEMDAALTEALRTVDDAAREALLQEAGALVIQDYGILPIHYEVTPWAMRKGLSYEPRVDQMTLVTGITAVE